MKRATLLGATGLIGGHVLEFLKKDNTYDKINVIVRRSFQDKHPKVEVSVIDFDNLEQFKQAMSNTDVVFCAIGTTQKKVNNDKAAYRKVDYDIPVNAANFSKEQGCEQFVVVSSLGADSKKNGFYLKLKGEVEDKLKEFNFKSLEIFRPSLLLGERKESRTLEDLGQTLSKALRFILPSKYKPVEGKQVAKAMVYYARKRNKGVHHYYYRDFMDLN